MGRLRLVYGVVLLLVYVNPDHCELLWFNGGYIIFDLLVAGNFIGQLEYYSNRATVALGFHPA